MTSDGRCIYQTTPPLSRSFGRSEGEPPGLSPPRGPGVVDADPRAGGDAGAGDPHAAVLDPQPRAGRRRPAAEAAVDPQPLRQPPRPVDPGEAADQDGGRGPPGAGPD